VRPHISDRLDGPLEETVPLGTRLLVGFHLMICPPCRRMRRSLSATRDALSALRDVDVADVDLAAIDGPADAPPPKTDGAA
jgi:hypothetical protein